ncbi:MAG TPA: winged helix-turn-helix domain-containing protein [Caulobacteraceae bacterium]
MPVIRISDATWTRLKVHARPLEDTADDVVKLALDALEAQKASSSSLQEVGSQFAAPAPRKSSRPRGGKMPQREFRMPLLRTLLDLGGAARVSVVRKSIEPRVAPQLGDADYALVSTGDPRWWNAVCWERAAMVREGLLDDRAERGVWRLTEVGRRQLFDYERDQRDPRESDRRAAAWAAENAEAIRVHNERIAERGIFGEDLRRW